MKQILFFFFWEDETNTLGSWFTSYIYTWFSKKKKKKHIYLPKKRRYSYLKQYEEKKGK